MPNLADESTTRQQPRTWQEMREWIEDILRRRTGEGVPEWNARVAALGEVDEAGLRRWLTEQGVTGYPQMLLVYERLGYPDYLLASADELVEAQYGDRPALRPILDAVLLQASSLGEVSVQTRKTYVTLVSPKRTFALIQATTRSRVDVGLRLPEVQPGGRLLPGKGLGNDYVNVKISLTSVQDVDDDVVQWLRRAYAANV